MTSGLFLFFILFLPTNMRIGKWSEKSAYKIPDLRMGLCLLDIYIYSINQSSDCLVCVTSSCNARRQSNGWDQTIIQ